VSTGKRPEQAVPRGCVDTETLGCLLRVCLRGHSSAPSRCIWASAAGRDWGGGWISCKGSLMGLGFLRWDQLKGQGRLAGWGWKGLHFLGFVVSSSSPLPLVLCLQRMSLGNQLFSMTLTAQVSWPEAGHGWLGGCCKSWSSHGPTWELFPCCTAPVVGLCPSGKRRVPLLHGSCSPSVLGKHLWGWSITCCYWSD